MICAQRNHLIRPLKLLAFFVSGTFLSYLILLAAVIYGGNVDYQNERRIEADRIASCAKNHGVGNCNDVPKTNHWRN